MKKNKTTTGSDQPPAMPVFPDPKRIDPVGARYQWEGNGGYCGEVSFISAGLYYGQYLSQYDVRSIASPGMAQNSEDSDGDYNAQLLLGVNDADAAKALKLDAEVYTGPADSIKFLSWVKQNVVNGYPVIIGVFNNESMLYPDTYDPNDKSTIGDSEYDHIVPVMEWGSARPLNEQDVTGDKLLLSDNGLYGPCVAAIPNDVDYYYDYTIPSFLADREQANTNGKPYSLLLLPEKKPSDKKNYGIAIKGVLDNKQETLPVHITTSINYEAPAIKDDNDARPASLPVTLTITVSGLTTGQTYNLYYYKNEADVPVENFNHTDKPYPRWPITATADTWSTDMIIRSDEKAFFRAVKAE